MNAWCNLSLRWTRQAFDCATGGFFYNAKDLPDTAELRLRTVMHIGFTAIMFLMKLPSMYTTMGRGTIPSPTLTGSGVSMVIHRTCIVYPLPKHFSVILSERQLQHLPLLRTTIGSHCHPAARYPNGSHAYQTSWSSRCELVNCAQDTFVQVVINLSWIEFGQLKQHN